MTKRDVPTLVAEAIARWRAETERTERDGTARRKPPTAIAMSHAVASGGEEIAARVGEALGIHVYDREIVHYIAHEANVHRAAVEALEEYALSRVETHVQSLLTGPKFNRTDYLRLLARTVAMLWERGPCVISGHGCVHLLPDSHVLTVRTVADFDDRVERFAQSEGMTRKEAENRLEDIDAERVRYHQKYFDADVNDPTDYDLILNTSRLDRHACAALIVEAYRERFAEPAVIAR